MNERHNQKAGHLDSFEAFWTKIRATIEILELDHRKFVTFFRFFFLEIFLEATVDVRSRSDLRFHRSDIDSIRFSLSNVRTTKRQFSFASAEDEDFSTFGIRHSELVRSIVEETNDNIDFHRKRSSEERRFRRVLTFQLDQKSRRNFARRKSKTSRLIRLFSKEFDFSAETDRRKSVRRRGRDRVWLRFDFSSRSIDFLRRFSSR